MRKMIVLWIGSVTFLFLTASCHQSARVTEQGQALTYVGYQKVLDDTLVFESNQCMLCETNDNSLFMGITRAEKYGDTYYFLDPRMRQVVMFDEEGHHVGTLRRIGSGQGEWSNIRDIAIDSHAQQLLLLVEPRSLLYYDLQGNFLKSMRLDDGYNTIGVDEKHIYLNKSTYTNNELAESSVAIIDKQSGQMTETLPPLPEVAPYCYAQGNFISGTGDRLLYTRRFDDNIYELSADGVHVVYSIDWKDSQFPESEKDHQWECAELNETCREKGYIYSMGDFCESDHLMLFTTNLMGNFLIDKQTGEVKRIGVIQNTVSKISLPTYLPVGGSPGECIFIYPANFLMKVKEMSSNTEPKSIRPGLKYIFDNINEDSNPVIFRCQLK